MDPLLLYVESTLKSLSQSQIHSTAYQSYLVIKDSVSRSKGQFSVPNFINLTFEAINGCLQSESIRNEKVDPNLKNTLIGLLTLQRSLLDVLDMDLLGANYISISQIIIKRLVDILAKIVGSKIGINVRYIISPIRLFCNIVEATRLNSQTLSGLLKTLTESEISLKEKNQISDCIVELLNISLDGSLSMLAVHKYIIHTISMCGKRQLDVPQDLSVTYHSQIILPLNSLYFKLINGFEESQVREYLDMLIFIATSKQQRHISEIALDCLNTHNSIMTSAELEHVGNKWIPLYILENLVNNVHEIKDVKLVNRYLKACGMCLCTLTFLKKMNIGNSLLDFDVKDPIEKFIHSLRQLIFTTDASMHSVVLISLYEIVQSVHKEVKCQVSADKMPGTFEVYQLFISAVLPFCSSVLEDYRYKLSLPDAVNLTTLLIESWDELLIVTCCSMDNTCQKIQEKRTQGFLLFEVPVRTCLNLAAVALSGGLSEGNISFRDVSNMKPELRRIVGSITRAFGPKTLLTFRPLTFQGLSLTDPEFPIKSNSWLLPLLRVHTTRTELSFFSEHLLPIAVFLSNLKADFQETDPNHAKLYQILEEQIWSLLPGFFDETLDFPDSFGSEDGVLRTYLLQLLDRDTTRDHICNALLRISRQTYVGRGLAQEDTEESYEAQKMCNLDNRNYHVARKTCKSNEEALKKHSKSFISLMIVKFLNFYSDDAMSPDTCSFVNRERESQHYLACIQSLVPFCDQSVLQSNLNNFHQVWDGMAKGIQNSNVPCSKIVALIDVAIAMTKRLPLEQVNDILKSFINVLSVILTNKSKGGSSEKTQLQKKLYKGLKACIDVLMTRTDLFPNLRDKILEMWAIFLLDSEKCPSNSLKHRLGCLRAFIQLLNKAEDREFVQKFGHERVINPLIPEILFCIREPNMAVRANAVALLKSLIECYVDSPELLETIIIKMITISRINTNQIEQSYIETSCVIALTMIILDYGDLIQRSTKSAGNSLLKLILTFVTNALNTQDPVMYVNSLKFVRVSLFRLDQTLINEYIPAILNNLLSNEKCSLKCRIQLRRVLIAIIKKVGAEKAMHAFPTMHVPLYRYLIRKINKSANGKRKVRDTDDHFGGELDSGVLDSPRQQVFPEGDGVLDSLEEDLEDQDESYGGILSELGRKRSKRSRVACGDDSLREKSLTIARDSDARSSDPIDLLSSKASLLVVPTGSVEVAKNARVRHGEEEELVRFDKKLNMFVVSDCRDPENKENGAELTSTASNLDVFGERTQPVGIGTKAPTRINTRSSGRTRKTRKRHIIVKCASEFKSKRSRGDVVKNGLQPFAYMRLNPALSKEKHKANATRSISDIFCGKKKK